MVLEKHPIRRKIGFKTSKPSEGEIFGIISTLVLVSTLLRCINLLETPTCGEVVVDGQDCPIKLRHDLRDLSTK